MLDAYIIERIRRERERERNDGAFVPLHIEPPREERPPLPDERDDRPKDEERGSVIIDFSL
jgi:hypothetical protein